ncbi:MAG: tRNA lysidine(34) synthetase TilS [Pseudonocardiaceae bacterium]|nr:tRNA lysidine(34) synthetase TilS [Pseudonocardiaceae bacterium]
MTGPDPAVAAVRVAVRRFLERHPGHGNELGVAVSGGADSLALAAACAYLGPRSGKRVHGLIVDHGLQPDSGRVAERAAKQLNELGLDEARVLPVRVEGPGGPEAAARRARYRALREARPDGHALILLGHTLNDQAETVLLGLGRGSGPRSVAGMPPLDPPWGRPLLEITRDTTRAACEALGLTPWQDPHNADPRFTRARLRGEALPLLEDVLGGGVAAALARTAAQLREDTEALDELAERLLEEADRAGALDVRTMAGHPAAIRRRALRSWLRAAGVNDLTDAQLRSVDALIGDWRGQGGVWLAGHLVAGRSHGTLHVHHEASDA